MIRKLLLTALWFPLTFVLLLLNLALLRSLYLEQLQIQAADTTQRSFKQITAAAGTAQILGTSVIAGDARALLLQSFLELHRSPMAPYANLIVSEADVNGLDFRLVVAIAMCESNLGKRMPKMDEFNAWGIAVYTGENKGKAFDSWPHAIGWVSQYIKNKYYDRGIRDLKDIGIIWAPPSVDKGNSWMNCVESFQGTIL
ncbi:hypothetical protein HY411_02545 [Candidatus Gottesmanbacteria bacterium]|nr:hypothetical protein [Candidatus Gottesmanbacteria bacterium]